MHPLRPTSMIRAGGLAALLLFTEAGHAQAGPGLGNIDCGDAEYFQPFAFIDHNYPGDPHGQNVTVMIRGYFMTVYAPDSCNRLLGVRPSAQKLDLAHLHLAHPAR